MNPSFPSFTLDCLRTWLAVGLLVLPPALGSAQSTTTPVPTEKTKAEEPAIELPPFEVRTDKDVGYAAQNTTSG